MLERICLADFATRFEHSTKANNSQNNDRCHKLNQEMGYMKERRKVKIMRYRKYSMEIDGDDYYRENLMLFLPWRCEENDILNCDMEKKYLENATIISGNSHRFNAFESSADELHDDNENLNANEEGTEPDIQIDDEYKAFDMQNPEYDLTADFPNLVTEPTISVRKTAVLLEDEEYSNMIRTLNNKQRKYLSHIFHNICNNNIFYEFISGKYIISICL